MATENQIQMIDDVEAAVSAMLTRKPDGVEFGEVCEMIRRDNEDVRQIIVRLGNRGEMALLRRLQAAFGRVKVTVPILESQFDGQQLVLAKELPAAATPVRAEKARTVPEAPQSAGSNIDVMGQVLRILAPLSESSRRSIMGAASRFYSIGE